MTMTRFALAVVVSGLAVSMTDWVFSGILFHDKYEVYPEVWRRLAGGESSQVVAGVALSVFTCAVFIIVCGAFQLAPLNKSMTLAFLIWS